MITGLEFRQLLKKDGVLELQYRKRETGGYWTWDNPRGEYWSAWKPIPVVKEEVKT